MILNLIGMVDKSISYMFRKFDPISRMIISRDSGLINDYFSITKGQLIDLNFFATMGEMENDREETYPVYEDGTENVIYVTKDEISKLNPKPASEAEESNDEKLKPVASSNNTTSVTKLKTGDAEAALKTAYPNNAKQVKIVLSIGIIGLLNSN